MLHIRIKQGRRLLPVTALPHALDRQAARREVGETIEALIAVLDALAGDTDLEPEQDRCAAGDDHMVSGPVMQRGRWERYEQYTGQDVGDEADAEGQWPALPACAIDQRWAPSRPIAA